MTQAETKHLSRTNDPETSSQSAAEAFRAHPDDRIAGHILGIMVDGLERTDEEIHEHYIEAIAPISDSRTRHGRKRLSDLNLLKEVGRKRLSTGGTGRVFRYQRNTEGGQG